MGILYKFQPKLHPNMEIQLFSMAFFFKVLDKLDVIVHKLEQKLNLQLCFVSAVNRNKSLIFLFGKWINSGLRFII